MHDKSNALIIVVLQSLAIDSEAPHFCLPCRGATARSWNPPHEDCPRPRANHQFHYLWRPASNGSIFCQIPTSFQYRLHYTQSIWACQPRYHYQNNSYLRNILPFFVVKTPISSGTTGSLWCASAQTVSVITAGDVPIPTTKTIFLSFIFTNIIPQFQPCKYTGVYRSSL